MASLKTSQILEQARKIILEESDEIISDADLLLFANLTKDDIGVRVPVREFLSTAAISLVNGIGDLPTDWAAWYKGRDSNTIGTGTKFDWYKPDQFFDQNFDNGVTILNNKLNVYPNTTATMYAIYYKTLADMTNAGDEVPAVPSYLAELIIWGTVSRALRILQEEDRSEYYANLYENELSKKSSGLSQQQESGQQDGQLFEDIQLI